MFAIQGMYGKLTGVEIHPNGYLKNHKIAMLYNLITTLAQKDPLKRPYKREGKENPFQREDNF